MDLNKDILGALLTRLCQGPVNEVDLQLLRNTYTDRLFEPNYIFASYWFKTGNPIINDFANASLDKIINAVNELGLIPLGHYNKFLLLRSDDMSVYLPKVDATIVFLHPRRNYLINNDLMDPDNHPMVHEYLNNGWVEIQHCDVLYHKNNDGQKFKLYRYQFYHEVFFPKGKSTYLMVVDTSLPDLVIAADCMSITDNILYSIHELKRVVGEAHLQTIAMSGMMLETLDKENEVIASMVDASINIVSVSHFLKKIILTDWTNAFVNYYRQHYANDPHRNGCNFINI